MSKGSKAIVSNYVYKDLVLRVEEFDNRWRITNQEGSFSTELFVGEKAPILKREYRDSLGNACMDLVFSAKTNQTAKLYKVSIKNGRFEETSYDAIDFGEECDEIKISEEFFGGRSEVTDNIRVEVNIGDKKQILIISESNFKPLTALLDSIKPIDPDDSKKGYCFTKSIINAEGCTTDISGTMDANFEIQECDNLDKVKIYKQENGVDDFCYRNGSTILTNQNIIFLDEESQEHEIYFVGSTIEKRYLVSGKVESIDLSPFTPISMIPSGNNETVILHGKTEDGKEKECYFNIRSFKVISIFVQKFLDNPLSELSQRQIKKMEKKDPRIANQLTRHFLYEIDDEFATRLYKGTMLIDGTVLKYLVDLYTGEIIKAPIDFFGLDEEQLISDIKRKAAVSLKRKQEKSIDLSIDDVPEVTYFGHSKNSFRIINRTFKAGKEKHNLILYKGRNAIGNIGLIRGIGYVEVPFRKAPFGLQIINYKALAKYVKSSKSLDSVSNLVKFNTSRRDVNVPVGDDILSFTVTSDEVGKDMSVRLNTIYTIRPLEKGERTPTYSSLFSKILFPLEDNLEDRKDGLTSFVCNYEYEGIKYYLSGALDRRNTENSDNPVCCRECQTPEFRVIVSSDEIQIPNGMPADYTEELLETEAVLMECKISEVLNSDLLISDAKLGRMQKARNRGSKHSKGWKKRKNR